MENKEKNEFVNEIKKSYYKNWRSQNKDKVKQYNSKYWNKRAQKIINDVSTTNNSK